MTLFEILKSLEDNEDLHLGRILILLNEFSSKSEKKEIEGLTKLAKLDFLLRYPVYLEKALSRIGKNQRNVDTQDYEYHSVEAKMVRFKYGPWDFRYRRFINTLVGLGLVYIRLEGRSYNLGLTKKGLEIVENLLNDGAYYDIANRARIIRINFNMSGSNLMKFIYKTFPEIGTLQYGTEIK